MMDPLPAQQWEFLAVMGLADEFTAEMARFVTGDADAEPDARRADRAERVCEVSARRRDLPLPPHDERVRRRSFRKMETQTQRLYWERFGVWYEQHEQYLHALAAYRRCGDFDALLRVIQKDAGILLASLRPVMCSPRSMSAPRPF